MVPGRSQENPLASPPEQRRRRGTLERRVRDALIHIHDTPYLGRHPLAPRNPPDGIDAGVELQRRLLEAIAALRPDDAGATPNAIRRHQLMALRYVQGFEITKVCVRLGIGLSQYHREHGPGLGAVAARFVADHSDVDAGVVSPGRYRTPFVGRESEVGFLTSQVEAIRTSDTARFVLIRGDAGVGKTRLARELGTLAGASGAIFLEGGYPREVADAYAAWADIVRAALRDRHPSDAAVLIGDDRAELGAICPELLGVEGSSLGAAAPAVGPASPRDRRRRLFDAIAGVLLRVAEGAPLVLLLDDLHWAPDLALVAHVFRRLAGNGVLFLATARRDDLAQQHGLAVAWGEFARTAVASTVALAPLSEEDSARIVAFRIAAPSPGFVGQVHRRSRGNPFFIEQLLDALDERGALAMAGVSDAAESDSMPMPDSVRQVIVDRLARLGTGVFGALAQAALLRQPFAFQVLLGMTGQDEASLLDAVDQAVAAHLLADRSTDEDERYAFVDDQLQEALAASIASPRRRRYHRRAGESIESLFAGRVESHVEELAAHFAAAGEAERAAAYESRAGQKTERLFAWSQALAYYRSAVVRLERLGGHLAERADLCERVGRLCYTSGIDAAQASDYLGRALALYEQSGDDARAAGVHTMLGLAYLAGSDYAARRTDLAADHLKRACERLATGAPTAGHALAEARLSLAYLALLDVPAGRVSARRAVELAERLGDAPALIEACTAFGSALTWAGSVEDGLSTLERAWGLLEGQALAAPRDALAMNGVIVASCLKAPRLGMTWAARTTELGKQTAHGRLMVPGYLTAIHALEGELTVGERLLTGLRRDWEGIGQPEFARQPAAVGLLLLRRGAWDEAQALLEAGSAWARACRYRWLETMTALRLGELFMETGEYVAAASQLRGALQDARAGGCVLVELGILPVLARAEVCLGGFATAEHHIADARGILDRAAEWGGLPADIQLAEGMLGAARGRWGEAEESFASACTAYRALGLGWDEARVYESWGEALAEAAERSGDADGAIIGRARERLSRARSAWTTMDAEPYAERCHRRLTRLG